MLLFLVKYSYTVFSNKGKNIPTFFKIFPYFSKYSCVFLLFYVPYASFKLKKISYNGYYQKISKQIVLS